MRTDSDINPAGTDWADRVLFGPAETESTSAEPNTRKVVEVPKARSVESAASLHERLICVPSGDAEDEPDSLTGSKDGDVNNDAVAGLGTSMYVLDLTSDEITLTASLASGVNCVGRDVLLFARVAPHRVNEALAFIDQAGLQVNRAVIVQAEIDPPVVTGDNREDISQMAAFIREATGPDVEVHRLDLPVRPDEADHNNNEERGAP